jgi:hypothetical protein
MVVLFVLWLYVGRIIAHNATNYPRYLTALEPYLAVYSFPWEPYFIADKSDLPRYDARFAGYGNDKAVQTYEMSWRGFKFLVMPDSFVIHIEHEAGPWRYRYLFDDISLLKRHHLSFGALVLVFIQRIHILTTDSL